MIVSWRWSVLSLFVAACDTDPSAHLDGDIGEPPDAGALSDSGPLGSDVDAPPVRCLSYSPAAYFYDVTLGRTETLRFSIRNTCPNARRILAVRVVGDEAAFELGPLPLPVTLEREEVLRIPVRFSPLEPKSHEAQIAIEVDDPEQPEFRVRVLGEGVGGELRALPSKLTLDVAPLGCRTASRAVALWNEGPGPMYVFSIELEGPDAEAFSFRHEPTLPRDVPAHEGLLVHVDFEPAKAGEHQATLLVTYNGRQSPARIPITGSGLEGRAREESLVLGPKPVHDLIFLAPPESRTRGEIEALLDFLGRVKREDELDLRVVITPSGARDVVLGEPVACPGFPAVLELPAIEIELLEVLVPCMVSVARPQAEARSSSVLVAALERSFVAPSSGLRPLRSDASVHAIFTTSYDASKVPLPFVLQFFTSLPRALPPALFVHGYDYVGSGRPSPEAARHSALIEATGGTFVDQRSDAWPRFFETLHAAMRDGPRPVVPALPPLVDTIELVDATTGSTVGYALEAEGGRLWVPAPAGRQLVLRYEARCETGR